MRFLPIAERELRVMARQNRTWWQRVLILIGALAIFAFAYISFRRWTNAGMMGRQLFSVLGGFSFAYALLSGPLVAVDSLSRERRDGTLGLLFLTDLRSYDIVLGKMAAASFGVILGLTAAAPVFAIPMLMGGINLVHLTHVAVAIC
jgi:ABC-type transport system involved in cytochrome c biogenesis permease component